MTYAEARAVLTENMAKSSPSQASKEKMSEAFAFLLTDVASSLSKIAAALQSLEAQHGAN